MQFAYPTQNRFNDAYQQRGTNYGSIYNSKYLSRASNDILKMFGDNIAVNGLLVTPTFLGSVITLTFTAGIVIHDSTVINLSLTNTLTCDVAALGDTPGADCHLAVFTSFQYIETPDLDAQTALTMSVYHVNTGGGIVTAFSGSPAFDATKNKIMVSALTFTKSGANVIACAELPSVLVANRVPYLTVLGTNYYMRGADISNINSWNYLEFLYSRFLSEFSFHDNIC